MLHFGTDGVRGVALDELTPELVRDLARAVVRVLQPNAVVVGRDTRQSGPVLERAVVDGCAAEGVPVHVLGVVPTPAVAFAAERHGWVGIVITASHNPWSDNGIKVFNAGGTKLSDGEQIEIEREWHSIVTEPAPAALGTVHDASDLVDEYVVHRVDVAGRGALSGLTVLLDCAHGAMSEVAPRAFREAGADVLVINDSPDGVNINEHCGAASPEAMARRTQEAGADLGVAFDGDGDRMVAATSTGLTVDGDVVMAICAADLMRRGLLRHKGVAVTVMSNLGFHRAMHEMDVDVVVTPVGDRNVLAALEDYDFVLGGEQSGHIVHRAHSTTGDGLLAALILCENLVRNHTTLDRASSIMTKFPQVLVNVRTDQRIDDPADVLALEIADAETMLGADGRVLVRASGTESLTRIMVEASVETTASAVAHSLADALISRHGGRVDGAIGTGSNG